MHFITPSTLSSHSPSLSHTSTITRTDLLGPYSPFPTSFPTHFLSLHFHSADADELTTGSWADAALSLLGYNADPATLQALIRTVYEMVREAAAHSHLHSHTRHNNTSHSH